MSGVLREVEVLLYGSLRSCIKLMELSRRTTTVVCWINDWCSHVSGSTT